MMKKYLLTVLFILIAIIPFISADITTAEVKIDDLIKKIDTVTTTGVTKEEFTALNKKLDEFITKEEFSALDKRFESIITKPELTELDKKIAELFEQNKPILRYANRGSIQVHGTEYTNKETAKVWLQLLDSEGNNVDDGICYTDIYTPDGGQLIEYSIMINMEHDGIYYLDSALTDLGSGVYPVIARCYYEAIQTNNFALAYFLINGTYDSGTIANTYVIDGSFIRFKEKNGPPAPEKDRISIVLNFTNGSICSNVSEDLLTGVSIRTVTKFDSAVNDDITLSVWNYTSSSWVDLPNKVSEGNAFRDVSNSFVTNNITKLGLVNATGSSLRLRYTDTTLNDGGPESNMDIDYATITCDRFANPEWQEIKGSSEIHISSTNDDPFYVETYCGSNENGLDTSACSMFEYDLDIYNVSWGYLVENISFINSYQSEINSHYDYETPLSQDCTGVFEITHTKDGVATDFLDNVTMRSGTNDNCIISIPVVFDNSTDREFFIEIKQENYMKWEVERNYDLLRYYRLPIESFCSEVETSNGITYQIPLDGNNDVSEIYASNPILLGCYRSIDDLYWLDYYYDEALPINTSGGYESYLYNSRLYYEELKDASAAVQGIIGENVLVHVNTLCGESSIYPNQYSCAKVMPPDAYFTSQEGYIMQNLTVVNDFNATSNGYYSYTTAPDVDCSAVMELIKDNGTLTDITDDVLFNKGDADNCNMNIPIHNTQGIPSYHILIYIENYLYWDIYWARDNVNLWNDTIEPFCQDIATNRSLDYILPINSSIDAYRNDSEFYFCYRAMDDLYWWYFFYDKLVAADPQIVGEIGSYHYESEFFWQRIFNDYNTVKTYQRNLNQVIMLSDLLDLKENTAHRVWNYSDRNLTYYPTASVNTTEVADAVWNYTGTIHDNILTQIATKIWNWINRYTHGVVI